MNKTMIRAASIVALTVAGVLGTAGTAAADHVDIPKPSGPPWTASADGLTYCFEGYCDNWDKLSNYVCTTAGPTAPICETLMVGVRLLPPLPIGNLVPHHIIS